MSCLYTRMLLTWDTPSARAKAATHAHGCPACAALLQRRAAMEGGLRRAAGELPETPERLRAAVGRETRGSAGAAVLSGWRLPWGLGLAAAVLVLVGVRMAWTPERPALVPTHPPVALRDIDAAAAARDIGGGIDHLTLGLARTAQLIPWRETQTYLAESWALTEGQKVAGTSNQAPAAQSQTSFAAARERLDPLGMTEARQWDRVLRFGRNVGLW